MKQNLAESHQSMALPGRLLRCSNFPGRRRGKGQRNEGREGKEVKERREKKGGRTGRCIRKEEEKVYKEITVLSLLPG